MKRFALVVSMVALAALVMGEASDRWPEQVSTCRTETHGCTSGSCSLTVADGGVDSGIPLQDVRGFTVKVCGTTARPLAGAGTLKDYHCVSGGTCAEVTSNALSVTLTGTVATPCQEFPPFVLPARLPNTDRMVWASSGVTISNWDGGTADVVSVTVCPTH
jgi:hypothetical protein